MTNLFQQILAILDESFVFVREFARILALAFAGRKNCLVFGPGGHGKSAMVAAVVEGLGLRDETFFQFFGEGMDEARLYGGLDFAKLEAEKVLEYHPENSFLNYRVAVFEELFDAPAQVLLALKDTLTAKELRNGSQRFPMKTEVIIVLTNKDPDELSELGPAAHALVERFPLHLDLKWADYSAGSYLRMFEKVARRLGGPILNGFKAVLAEVVAKATAEGQFISPRTAVHAYEVCQTAALLRGADHVSQEDLADLRFVDGLEDLGEQLQEQLSAALERSNAKKAMEGLMEEYRRLQRTLEEAGGSPIKLLQVAKMAVGLEDRLANTSVTDDLVETRNGLREEIGRMISSAQARALESTRV